MKHLRLLLCLSLVACLALVGVAYATTTVTLRGSDVSPDPNTPSALNVRLCSETESGGECIHIVLTKKQALDMAAATENWAAGGAPGSMVFIFTQAN